MQAAWNEWWEDHQEVCATPDNEQAHEVAYQAGWEDATTEVPALHREIKRLQSEAHTQRMLFAAHIKQLGGAILIENRTLVTLHPLTELRREEVLSPPGTLFAIREPEG